MKTRKYIVDEIERFVHQGVALVPQNIIDIGEGLYLLMDNGDRVLLKLPVTRFLKELAYYYGVDLTALRNMYGQALGRKQLIPLPFAGDWILVPLKVRVPIGKQTAYGWFVPQMVQRVNKTGPRETRLHLVGPHEVLVYHSLEFYHMQMRHVTLVQHRYYQIHLRENPPWTF